MENTNTTDITITIADRNGETINYVAKEGQTYYDLLNDPAVIESFERLTENEKLENYLNELNGAEIPAIPSMRTVMFRAAIEKDDFLVFDLNFVKEEVPEEQPSQEASDDAGTQTQQPQQQNTQTEAGLPPADGIVIVEINGGLQRARVNVIPGYTTLRTVVHAEAVKIKSGETDERLDGYVVIYDGVARKPFELDTIRVKDSDVIQVTPPTLSGKGLKIMCSKAIQYLKGFMHRKG